MIIEEKNVAYLLHGKYYHCAMDITARYIGGKWKSVVLWYLRHETLRFVELKRKIPDITEKMLSIQLQALEADGLVKREAFGEKPPIRVQYSMTELGKSLIPMLEEIAKWGRHLGETEGEIVAL